MVPALESGWEADFRAWFNRTGKALHKYLREQLIGVPPGMRPPALSDLPEVLPVLGAGLPPDTGKPRHVIHIDEGEDWLRKALDELRELQSALATANRATTKRPTTEPPAAERHKWPSLATVGAVASIIGVVLAVVLFFYH